MIKTKFVASCLLFCLSLGINTYANNIEIDLEIIKELETGGESDPNNAVGLAGEIGAFQIKSVVLKEYNHYNGVNYEIKDLYNPLINKKIANWYLHKRVPQMLKAKNIPITLEHVLLGYCWGCGNLKKHFKEGLKIPKVKRKYVDDYKLKRDKNFRVE